MQGATVDISQVELRYLLQHDFVPSEFLEVKGSKGKPEQTILLCRKVKEQNGWTAFQNSKTIHHILQ